MKQRGFSIIEIAVTLVVMGMVLASAVPGISSWLRNAKLRNQAESLQAGLQTARNEALRRNRAISFYLVNQPSGMSLTNDCAVSASGTSWVVSVRDPGGACAAAPTLSSSTSTNPLIVSTHLGADGATGVAVSGVDTDLSTSASRVTFDALGRRVSGIVRITVDYASSQTNDRPLRVDIGTTGNVRTCDTSISNTSDPRRCM
jgi:type IV fimbrial biogenesis protein FimT